MIAGTERSRAGARFRIPCRHNCLSIQVPHQVGCLVLVLIIERNSLKFMPEQYITFLGVFKFNLGSIPSPTAFYWFFTNKFGAMSPSPLSCPPSRASGIIEGRRKKNFGVRIRRLLPPGQQGNSKPSPEGDGDGERLEDHEARPRCCQPFCDIRQICIMSTLIASPRLSCHLRDRGVECLCPQ